MPIEFAGCKAVPATDQETRAQLTILVVRADDCKIKDLKTSRPPRYETAAAVEFDIVSSETFGSDFGDQSSSL
jgi:hypothetical protein